MKVSRPFSPVTVVFETEEEFSRLLAVLQDTAMVPRVVRLDVDFNWPKQYADELLEKLASFSRAQYKTPGEL